MISTRKERIGWYMYDWANSAFVTTVITVFLGPYLTAIAKNAADASGFLHPYGISVYYGSVFGYAVSFSVFLQIFLLPYLGALADTSHNKKLYLGIFAYLGSFATCALYYLNGNNYLFGSAMLVLANLSFGASIVIYNSMLNDVSSKENSDKISSIGWAIGYIGGGIALALNLIVFSNASSFGITEGEAVRISFVSTGIWWALFTTVSILLSKKLTITKFENQSLYKQSFLQLKDTIKHIKEQPKALKFLIAFLFYNDGIQAVITFSSIFAMMELKMAQSEMITAILLVQFVAFFGALLFGKIASKIGAKSALIYSLIIWISALICCYFFVKNGTHFYYLAIVIAIVLGGTQALSRSLYSRLIPANKEAEYFSLYEISDRGTSWLGTFLFSFSLQFTQSYRIAILSLIVFFVIGLSLLWNFKEEG